VVVEFGAGDWAVVPLDGAVDDEVDGVVVGDADGVVVVVDGG
jgi:hypothetical protein